MKRSQFRAGLKAAVEQNASNKRGELSAFAAIFIILLCCNSLTSKHDLVCHFYLKYCMIDDSFPQFY